MSDAASVPGGPKPYLDVVVHCGVSGQFLRLLCHVRCGATERTHVCVAAAESCLLPGYSVEESSGGGGGGGGANEGGPALQSHDLTRQTDGRTDGQR